jgi:hypothetical protein
MGSTHWRIVQIPSASNPMFGAKRLSLNRDTEPVVAVDAQHQIGVLLLSEGLLNSIQPSPSELQTLLLRSPTRWSIRINASRSVCQALFIAANHTDYRNYVTPNRLVELTGIEPVASWLQTRRSPS